METKAAGSLTHGRLGKQILAFSLPLMLSNVLQVLFNMSDIAVVGRFSGPIALGAVGSTATLNGGPQRIGSSNCLAKTQS